MVLRHFVRSSLTVTSSQLLLRCRELVREEETALMEELDEAQREAKEARVAVFRALREQEGEQGEGGVGLTRELQDAIDETGWSRRLRRSWSQRM